MFTYNRRYEFAPEYMVEELEKHTKYSTNMSEIDFLCLQEVGASNWEMGSIDILDYFGNKLGLHYGSYGQSQIATNGFNVALLSRYPLKKIYKYNLPNVAYQSNMVVAELDINLKYNYSYPYYNFNSSDIINDTMIPDGVAVICAHLKTGNGGSNKAPKKAQIESIRNISNNYVTLYNYGVLTAGDWNLDMKGYCDDQNSNCDILIDNPLWTLSFEDYYENVKGYQVSKMKEHLYKLRSEKGASSLLDYGFNTPHFQVNKFDIMQYHQCFNVCLTYGSYDNDCSSCSVSDHLGVTWQFSLP